MAGPKPIAACGNSWRTAVARTCADECRSTPSAAGALSVTIATLAPRGGGRGPAPAVPEVQGDRREHQEREDPPSQRPGRRDGAEVGFVSHSVDILATSRGAGQAPGTRMPEPTFSLPPQYDPRDVEARRDARWVT